MNSLSVIQLLAIGAGLLLTAQFAGVWLAYCIAKYILPLIDERRACRLDDSKIMKGLKEKGLRERRKQNGHNLQMW